MRSRQLTLVPPAVYAVISAGYFSSFLAHPQRGVPGGPDGILYAWYFEWVHQAVIHLHNPLFSHDMNAPFGFNVMWNTPLLVLSVLFLPLTATIGPVPTVGILMVLAPVVSASTCYFVLRHITGRALGPALAAAIYGFGPFFAGQAGHLNLSFDVLPPLLLLFGHQILIKRTPTPIRSGVWFGVVLGLQMLISEEVVVLCAIGAVVTLGWLAVLYPKEVRPRLRDLSIGSGVAVAITVVLAGVPLAYQFFGPGAFPHGLGFKPERADLAAIVRPSVIQLFASDADIRANYRFHSDPMENTGYLGWPLLLLLVGLSVWYMVKHDRFGYWWLGSVVTVVLLSAGSRVEFNGTGLSRGPWLLVRKLPLLGGVVTPRFSLLTTLLVTLILARWLAGLQGRPLVAGTVVVVLAAVPLIPRGPYDHISPVRAPRFFASSAVNVIPAGATVYVMPYRGDPDDDAAAQVMAWQTKAHLRFRLIGGYSVFNRDGELSYAGVEPAYTAVLDAAGRRGLTPLPAAIAAARSSVGTSGTRYIVITRLVAHQDSAAAAAQALTGCAPEPVADVLLCAVPA